MSRPRRGLTAFGGLDKKTRRWTQLPPVSRSAGSWPNGDNLVYGLNDTTLEVGQGLGGIRGMFWLPGAVGFGGLLSVVAIVTMIPADAGLDLDVLDRLFLGVGVLMYPFTLVFSGFLFINDLFGYLDSPLRFDRARRKVYVWTSRKEGPLVLDWDQVKPVAQSVNAPPYHLNQFRSVLLVDEDEHGEVRFDGRYPRIAQIGAALLNKEQVRAAYEYVRVFMEQGPQHLPKVSTSLVMRPRGWRPFVDIVGICRGMMRDYPSLPKHRRKPGWLAFGVILVALFAFVLWPLQLAQGFAVKVTARVPKWSAEYEAMAAEGGPLLPPAGSMPNDAPMLPHERVITGIWVASACLVYALIAWSVVR